jgi:hypothetical protein
METSGCSQDKIDMHCFEGEFDFAIIGSTQDARVKEGVDIRVYALDVALYAPGSLPKSGWPLSCQAPQKIPAAGSQHTPKKFGSIKAYPRRCVRFTAAPRPREIAKRV